MKAKCCNVIRSSTRYTHPMLGRQQVRERQVCGSTRQETKVWSWYATAVLSNESEGLLFRKTAGVRYCEAGLGGELEGVEMGVGRRDTGGVVKRTRGYVQDWKTGAWNTKEKRGAVLEGGVCVCMCVTGREGVRE